MRVCVGGTFEYLHAGHGALLSRAIELADELLIGVTSERLALFTRGREIPFLPRIKAVDVFIRTAGFTGPLTIVPLDDPFGPAATGEIDAIVVSEDTEATAHEINQARKEGGLDPLEVFVVPIVTADDGGPLSSTRIREGSIDTDGKVLRPGATF